MMPKNNEFLELFKKGQKSDLAFPIAEITDVMTLFHAWFKNEGISCTAADLLKGAEIAIRERNNNNEQRHPPT
jgi:hypothetical protein